MPFLGILSYTRRKQEQAVRSVATPPIKTIQLLLVCLAVFASTRSMGQSLPAYTQNMLHAEVSKPVVQVRKNVDLVMVTVTVLDRSERSVSGLSADQFSVLEDKASQTIRYFSNEDEPIALAVVLDSSASMASRFEDVKLAASELIDTSNPQDEFHIVAVGDTPQVEVTPGDSLDDFLSSLGYLRPAGQTALWDTMMLALKQLRTAPLQRKAMVVISDGGDNHSRITEQELKFKLKEAGVQMYAIGIYDPFAYRKEERLGPFELDELTSASGGRMISVRNRAEILSAVRRISRELRDQYVLGYYTSRPERDGKWHKVKVTLTGISNPRELRVFSRKGYFQPAD